MKDALVVVALSLPRIVLGAGAIYLAAIGASAWVWPWFLVAALLATGSYNVKGRA